MEVVLQLLLIERNVGHLEEEVLEVVEVPLHRLAVEGLAGVAYREVEILAAAQLYAHQLAQCRLEVVYHILWQFAAALLFPARQVAEQRLVAEVGEQVVLPVVAHGQQSRHVDAFAVKEVGEGEESLVLFHIVVVNPHQGGAVRQEQAGIDAVRAGLCNTLAAGDGRGGIAGSEGI